MADMYTDANVADNRKSALPCWKDQNIWCTRNWTIVWNDDDATKGIYKLASLDNMTSCINQFDKKDHVGRPTDTNVNSMSMSLA